MAPDVVVLEFIGNYRAFGTGIPGLEPDTPEFDARWLAEARALTRIALGGGARVYWLLGPAVREPTWDARIHRLSAGYARLASDCPGVDAIDAFRVLGDPWAPGPFRQIDGAHLTPEGAGVMARAVLDAVGDPYLWVARVEAERPRPCRSSASGFVAAR